MRNDIYVTIKGGEFTRGPAKTADKNVEVTMVVCNNKGEILQVFMMQLFLWCSSVVSAEHGRQVYRDRTVCIIHLSILLQECNF